MNKPSDREASDSQTDGDPPFLGTWKRLYWGVFIYLFTLIAALWGITRLLAY